MGQFKSLGEKKKKYNTPKMKNVFNHAKALNINLEFFNQT